MSEERRLQPNVYMEPVHTNGMVIYGYSGSPHPQYSQQYGPQNTSQQYGSPNLSQQYTPRSIQNSGGNYSRNYSTPPPLPPNDIPFRYKPTIAEYYAKYYTPHALRPQPIMTNEHIEIL